MMDPQYVSAVKNLLSDPVADIRFEAAEALGLANTPESIAVLTECTRRERYQKVWARAWLSLRHLLRVDGVVRDKFRINRNLQVVPTDEPMNEVGYTFFFVQLENASSSSSVNVPRQIWTSLKIGDRLSKEPMSDDFRIHPAGESRS